MKADTELQHGRRWSRLIQAEGRWEWEEWSAGMAKVKDDHADGENGEFRYK